ncbi:hypothetical protein VE00_05173 [Pseudogymnoascus sp. WSF 3629]|nr:hypothetical protein VE00_05173 [Pseudogymnoascus sp. WSF 3629]
MGSEIDSETVSFNTYRPSYHFIAPHSWMNDPCGAAYIPEIKEYILCYQWHPGTVEPGNSAWGMARSKDLITWVDCFPPLRNGAPGSYDPHGVFSGSLVSRVVNNRRVVYLFYTSISALPIHWSKPYIAGCESQSLACSTDFGHSWHRYQENPVLSEPRHGAFTTGWRDPFVSTWPSLSALRDVHPSTNYMLLSSGERGRGPELVLYESGDLLSWTELCVLFDAPSETPISHHASSLHIGKNFECGSFFTLNGKEYIITAVEENSSRYVLWMCGALSLTPNGKPTFTPLSHGAVDHGIYYGPHVFRGAKNEVMLSGWADEDLDASPALKTTQGWSGCLTLPRELFTLTRPLTPADPETVDTHLWTRDEELGTMTTLGVRPARQLRGLRSGSMIYSLEALRHLRSKAYEIEARFRGLAGNELLTFNVRQSPNDEEVTRIVFSLAANSVSVDRSKSSLLHGRLTPDSGPFKLQDGEDLHVRVFVDNSIIEVYANGRFALSTRVYPSRPDSLGASCAFEGLDSQTAGVWMQVWEGLVGAWPERGREVVGLDARMGEMEIADEEYEEYEDGWSEGEEDAEFEVYGAFERGKEMGGVGVGGGVGVEARAVVA